MTVGYTSHYGLETLNAAVDSLSVNDSKFFIADREFIDRLLYAGAQGHHHTGAAAAVSNPVSALTSSSSSGGGTLSGTYYYEYTYVDATGAETAPSPVETVTVGAALATPGAPTLASSTASGTLPAGGYFYELTAYVGTNTAETVAGPSAYIALSATGENTITFPTAPSGATGWNIYRKPSNGSVFGYLSSVAVATSSYTDNGTVAVNNSRTPPTSDQSSQQYSVTLTIPSLPAGCTTNIYRSTNSTVWTDTFLANAGTGGSYTDTGAVTSTGTPPVTSEIIGSPPQVNLATDVTGTLPPANVEWFPMDVTFTFPGSLSVEHGVDVWVNNYTTAQVLSVTPTLGRGSAPASQPVKVDVLWADGLATPVYSSIFAQATPVYPEVPVGYQIGTAVSPPGTVTLDQGDSLVASILQTGGGATPTDHDLQVIVHLWVKP